MTEFYEDLGLIIPFLCLCPLVFLLWDFQHWLLVAYNAYKNYRVKKAHQERETACHREVYLNEDPQGPYMILDGHKFYIIAMKAKPLKGPLIGKSYYTSKKSDILSVVEDSGF